jgi:NPL4 family
VRCCCVAQIGTKSSIELVEDEDVIVNHIAAKLHLRKVGWIFTDLVPLFNSDGAVKQCRGDVVGVPCTAFFHACVCVRNFCFPESRLA